MRLRSIWLAALLTVGPTFDTASAQNVDQLIAAAKSEKELSFIAGPTTFGGKKGLAEIEAAFAKRFGFDAKIRFAAGPEMNAMAARVISEFKAGGKATTDIYLGSLGQFANLARGKRLGRGQLVGNVSGSPAHGRDGSGAAFGLFIATRHHLQFQSDSSGQGAEDYEDLSILAKPDLDGKIAVPPYPNWLVELSLSGRGKLKDFTVSWWRSTAAAALRRERAGVARRVPNHGEHRRLAGDSVEVAGQRRAAGRRPRFHSRRYFLFPSRRAEKFRPPNSPNCRRLHDFQGGQDDCREAEFRSSHLSRARAWPGICAITRSSCKSKDLSISIQRRRRKLNEELVKMLKQ